MTTATVRDLNRQLADDTDGAFPDLVRTFQDGVYSGALQLTRNVHDAQDVTQETFVRVYRALQRYDDARIRSLDLRPWIWTIALNLCRNRARAKSRRPEVNDIVDRPAPDQDPGEQVVADDLTLWRDRLARISGPQRTAVVLHHVVGLPHGEISAITGRTGSTTRSDLRRGLSGLRAIIEEES
jgi:RNA polymerase sigma factor (sigma-70 family)